MTTILLLAIVLVASDQLLKTLINSKFVLNESVAIIKDFFNITLAHNYGAAWSIFSNKSFFLIIVGFVALIIIYFYFIKNKSLKKFDIILISMLIAGIIGNMIDRIRFGYVIDYLDFNILGYDYPIFNFADILIVVSMLIIIIKSLKEEYDVKNNSRNK